MIRCQSGMAFPDSDGFGGGSDSGGFGWIPSSPAWSFLAYFAVCMGILDPVKTNCGFGRIR